MASPAYFRKPAVEGPNTKYELTVATTKGIYVVELSTTQGKHAAMRRAHVALMHKLRADPDTIEVVECKTKP